jgi:hypothetical protein
MCFGFAISHPSVSTTAKKQSDGAKKSLHRHGRELRESQRVAGDAIANLKQGPPA